MIRPSRAAGQAQPLAGAAAVGEVASAGIGPGADVAASELTAIKQTFAADECRVLAGASAPESYGKLHPTFTQCSCTPKLIERQMIPIGKP